MSDSVSPSPRADYRAGAEELGASSVEVVRLTERIALVNLVGEHDIATKDSMMDAFASAAAQPCIVVDFSRCTFVDSSAINVLVALHGTGISVVRLVVPEAQRIVWRTFEIVQMNQFFAIHESLEQALLAATVDDLTERDPAQEVAP